MKPLNYQILLILMMQMISYLCDKSTKHKRYFGDLGEILPTYSIRQDPYYFDFGSKKTLCPQNRTCLDGKKNFLCRSNPMEPSKECARFLLIKYTERSKLKMVHVHNGLRNMISRQFLLSNMYLVYWNIHLQHMAEQYLHMCKPISDTCRIIGAGGYEVGQNTLFVQNRHVAVPNDWEGRTVRLWVIDLLAKSGKLTKTNTTNGRHDHVKTLVQVMMPKLEFIGCAAAIMLDGFFVVCYYYPPAKEKLSSQLTYMGPNETCICSPVRRTCSTLFGRLCGIDIVSSATKIEFSAENLFLIIYFIWISLAMKKIWKIYQNIPKIEL